MQKIRGFEKISYSQWVLDASKLLFQDSLNSMYDKLKLPVRATSHSAGYDIFSTADVWLYPEQDFTFPLGWKVFMQPDECFIIIPRSGLGFKYYLRLANTTGLIDYDYYNNSKNEGHCFAKIRNEGTQKLHVEHGMAIAQGIFQKYLLADGDEFSGNRREGGMGSTG